MTLAITNHGNGTGGGVSPDTAAYTTSGSNDIVFLAYNNEPSSAVTPVTISSIVDSNGNTWARRTVGTSIMTNGGGLNTYNSTELWWASVPVSGSGSLTINRSGTTDDSSWVWWAISGFTNFGLPFDNGAGAPATQLQNGTGSAVPGAGIPINTLGSDVMVFSILGSPDVMDSTTIPSSMTKIDGIANHGGVNDSTTVVTVASYAGPQTGLIFDWNGGGALSTF